MEIKSPITDTNNIEKEREIKSSFIIDEYERQLKIDVSSYFENIEHITLYRCSDTGYKFFYPRIEADGRFYEQLQEFPWYYMDWKWEHRQAQALIGGSAKVLEVGSGKGTFVKKMVDDGVECHGLELNRKSVESGRKKGLKIFEATVENYAKEHAQEYDAVCSFQVLEHIYEVRAFLDSTLAVIKPGGKLVLSVPNNDSFLGADDTNILDMPPHHAGLWNQQSLVSLSRFFKLELVGVHTEPLQRYHYLYFYHVRYGRRIEEFLGHAGRIVNKLLSRLYYLRLVLIPSRAKGHTVLAEFKKK